MHVINPFGIELQLLAEKAVYVADYQALLVADVHLGKAETFQRAGVPIPDSVNRETLERLHQLCNQLQPTHLVILGDLLHARGAGIEAVLQQWVQFTRSIAATVHLLIGNHDTGFRQNFQALGLEYRTEPMQMGHLLLSHEPLTSDATQTVKQLNICGHIHPCVRIKTRFDHLRLPCFYLETTLARLILPAFGSFTGGYDVSLTQEAIAYAIADTAVIPFTPTHP